MAIFYTPRHHLHATAGLRQGERPFYTEELPERAEILLGAARKANLGEVEAPHDHGLEPILAVHRSDFVEFLSTIYAKSSKRYGQAQDIFPEIYAPPGARRQSSDFDGQVGYYCFGSDSPILAGTWEAAYWSAQTALSGAVHLHSGGQAAYAICRPPGHHAATAMYGGFCYLNNAAIAARYLGEGTAILDIDYHHGNGTQEIFYRDPGVLFLSLHADPDSEYPYYWGGADERGEGAGIGFNRNWPLPRGTEDKPYFQALDEALNMVEDFGARWLVVSAGFDTAAGDPVGGFRISPAGFQAIGQRIWALKRPTLIVQEGGYLLERLEENAVAFLEAFREASDQLENPSHTGS